MCPALFITRGFVYVILIPHYLVILASPMVTQKDIIPSDLTDNNKAVAFQFLNTELNSGILQALLYGGQ